MENHPIPQDVTGFKFRLIGSITVKQFLYLLGAGGIALVFWILPFPFLIKIPFMLLSAGIGLCLAFVPIDGRPMDKMLMNFIKTIPSENQYIYHKMGAQMPYFSFTPVIKAAVQSSEQRGESELNKKTLLFNQLSRAYFKSDPDEQAQVANVSALFQEGAARNQGFTQRVVGADTTPAKPATNVSPVSIVKPPAETLSKPHAPSAAKPAAVPVAASIIQEKPAQNTAVAQPGPVQSAPAASASGVDIPNIIQGNVIDPRGKPIPHVIVEIMDAQNTPLRTFRTNQNGGFMAATPMPNGTYTIHLEDTLKKQEFSDVSVMLNGTITPPVTIKSIDQREKLRQELFGGAA